MKILHINSYYLGSKFYSNIYTKQNQDNLDISVFVPTPLSIDKSDYNLGDYTLVSKNHGKYDRIFFHLKHNKIYNDIINQYSIKSFTYIHAHSLYSNGYIAYRLNKAYNIPYMVAVRNADVNTFFKKMLHLRKTGINILLNAHKVVFISKTNKDHVLKTYIPKKYLREISKKSVVIGNGVSDFWLNNKGSKKSLPKDKSLKLLYVGDVNKNKNITTTIKACKILIKAGYKVEYTIVGKLRDKSYLKHIEANKFIKYISFTKKEELLRYYRNADIFIMPSKSETFGIVYLEAMSQGLPLIYTKGQGFDKNFSDGKVGYRVKYNDEVEIVDKIKLILKNYEIISSRCLLKVDNFNWDHIVKTYKTIYKDGSLVKE